MSASTPKVGLPISGDESRIRPPTTLSEQREQARLTALKIDEIELEMRLDSPNVRPLPTPNKGIRPRVQRQNPSHPQVQASRRASSGAPKGNTEPITSLERVNLTLLGSTAPNLKAETLFRGLPVIEEAAVLYANGQIDAAARSLALARAAGGSADQAKQLWLMELDLLALRGQTQAFEQRAIEFVQIFEISPPIPIEGRPLVQGDVTEAQVTDGAASAVIWTLPVVMNDKLQKPSLGLEEKGALRIDCSNVRSISSAAIDGLSESLTLFEQLDRVIEFVAPQRLLHSIETCCSVNPMVDSSWMVLLWIHRLLGNESAFDQCGLRFAQALEVSPPSWAPLREGIKVVEAIHSKSDHALRLTQSVEIHEGRVSVEGVFEGHPEALLQVIERQSQRCTRIEIDCRKLTRLDFSAGGHLVNLIASLKHAGKHCIFLQPNQMVAALLLVLGVHDHAYLQMEKT